MEERVKANAPGDGDDWAGEERHKKARAQLAEIDRGADRNKARAYEAARQSVRR